jgi:hypothetical protein
LVGENYLLINGKILSNRPTPTPVKIRKIITTIKIIEKKAQVIQKEPPSRLAASNSPIAFHLPECNVTCDNPSQPENYREQIQASRKSRTYPSGKDSQKDPKR